MALTATATPQVRKDICSSLKLKNPLITCSSFDRPNLYLSVGMKSGNMMKDLQDLMKKYGNGSQFEGPVIIYCPTKKAAESVNSIVQLMSIKSGLYHAGLSLSSRKSTHKQFVNDEIQVVVATVAFGMGIDKPDVRLVVHYGAPKDIESYYQEIGRAGRDGQPSCCHVYYNNGDFFTSRFFLKDIKDGPYLEHKTTMLKKMEQYLVSTSCRRRTILSHFENKAVQDVGGTDRCCDNCTERILARRAEEMGLPVLHKTVQTKKNYGKEAADLISAVRATGERYGATVPIMLLRGSSSQRLPSYLQKHAAFGKGKYKTEKWWKAFARQIISEGYLKEVSIPGSFGSTVEVTGKGTTLLRGSNPELLIFPNKELQQLEAEPIKPTVLPASIINDLTEPVLTAAGVKSLATPRILPFVPTNTWLSTKEATNNQVAAPVVGPKEQQNQRDLYAKLIAVRNEMSQEIGIPSFVLFSNKSLLDLAKYRPSSMENMLKIEEISGEKAQKYGDRMLEVIKTFCSHKNWTTNWMPQDVPVTLKMTAKQEAALSTLSDTVRQSYKMFEQESRSLESVAQLRGLKTSTIVSHLADAIKQGLPVDIDRLGVSPSIVQLITDTIRKDPINSDISRLTPIKEQLPEYIEFNHIKVVIAILQHKFGMTDNCVSYIPQQENKPALIKSQSAPPSSSQDTNQGTKRKLPSWMTAGSLSKKAPSTVTTKNKFKNSLFSR